MNNLGNSIIVSLGILLFADIASAAERRVALIIGNSSYSMAPLASTKNDANDVADSLAMLGFDVIRRIDIGRNDLANTLEDFQSKTADADATMFYFAGHAMQYNGQDYLMPIDATLEDDLSITQLTSLTRIRDVLAACGSCVKIMIIDACRDNPLIDRFLERQLGNSSKKGLAPLSDKPDGIVVFATKAGNVCSNGESRNSTFTQALLAELKKPKLGLDELFNDVALDVEMASGGTQVPSISYSSIPALNDFFLNRSGSTKP